MQFDLRNPDIEVVRRVIFERLRREPEWHNFDTDMRKYSQYVELIGNQYNAGSEFISLSHDVIWQLIFEGVLAQGLNSSNPGYPWFHRTSYGKKVIESETPPPNDPTGYLQRLSSKVPNIDATVKTYIEESLLSYRKGNLIASTVMLGIAAERVFQILCESFLSSLTGREKDDFEKIMNKFPMKPKLDWVNNKIQSIQKNKPSGFPENASLMISAIYDFLRLQRNDLGHPRELPPKLDREEAYNNLLVFPRYYETAEAVRTFLANPAA